MSVYPIAEFRKVARRAVRRGVFTLLAGIATVLLFVVTALHLSDPWSRLELPTLILLVWGTIAAAGLTLACEVGAKLARHPYTRCPHCRGLLADSVPLVVAGGCCSHCGWRVLDPPADDPPPDALVPRADFLAADSSYQSRAAPVLVLGVFASYLGFGGAVIALEKYRLPFPLNWALFLALLLVAPVSLVAVMRWLYAGGKRNPALACPACGKLLAGARMLVAATGNCAECGCRAIVPRTRPLAPPHLGSLWTIPQLTAIEKRRQRYTWWVLTLVGLVAVATLALVLIGRLLWEEDRLRQMGLKPHHARWVERNGPLAVGVVGAVVGLVAARRAHLSNRRRHPHDCPRCGRELLPPFARATRCCHRCGWPVVATSPQA